jgi:hypothetical protein
MNPKGRDARQGADHGMQEAGRKIRLASEGASLALAGPLRTDGR